MTPFVSKFASVSSNLQLIAPIESQKSQLSNETKTKPFDAFNHDLYLILAME